MRSTSLVLSLIAGVTLAGCGETSVEVSPPPKPLTVNEWKTMPLDKKYAGETLEQLKMGDPSLDTAEGWEKFQRTVVIPARRRDFPNGKPR